MQNQHIKGSITSLEKRDSMKINWKIRLKNPVFIAQIILAILTPVLAYVGLAFEDLTSWATVGDLIQQAYSNPYLLGLVIVCVFNNIREPPVGGCSDSMFDLSYLQYKFNKFIIYRGQVGD